ncbi:MAG TPA: DUF6496 domain-containing protein [Candidatus Polarisedimenticolia bacterium]|jgi:hypothetical protein|nr:DUF6496 domain-containing protein [Candidatus Polarisedimenticolia bacterium]
MPQKSKSGSTRSRSGSSRSGSSGSSRKRGGKKRYGDLASQKVERAMHEYKRGQLKSGRSGKRVKSRDQAIAIGLSEARRKGGKVPSRSRSRSSRSGSRSHHRAA